MSDNQKEQYSLTYSGRVAPDEKRDADSIAGWGVTRWRDDAGCDPDDANNRDRKKRKKRKKRGFLERHYRSRDVNGVQDLSQPGTFVSSDDPSLDATVPSWLDPNDTESPEPRRFKWNRRSSIIGMAVGVIALVGMLAFIPMVQGGISLTRDTLLLLAGFDVICLPVAYWLLRNKQSHLSRFRVWIGTFLIVIGLTLLMLSAGTTLSTWFVDSGA